jgi:hypothetical protein
LKHFIIKTFTYSLRGHHFDDTIQALNHAALEYSLGHIAGDVIFLLVQRSAGLFRSFKVMVHEKV